MEKITKCRIINIAVMMFFLLGAATIAAMTARFFLVVEPARDQQLADRLEIIDNARNVDDLKPLLRSMVQRQRHDYR